MEEEIKALFESHQRHQYQVANTHWKDRVKKLHGLQHAIEKSYRKKLQDALYADFGKPSIETDLTEIYQVIKEIKHAKNHLNRWVAPQKVSTPTALLGTKSWYQYEPRGVCLVISPWNFPVNLTLGPLVSAIAAGNTTILKPSEMTPHTAAVMANIVRELFSENEVALLEGGLEVSQALLNLPFNHIFFTGSTRVGKIVMKAAAEHLSSVTLELGGKSPTIVDSTANLKDAAKKIAWGKFINAGQICISPDFLLVKESVKEPFIKALKQQITTFYTENPQDSSAYSRIVNKGHYERLTGLLEDAKKKGGIVAFGGVQKDKTKFIAPTLVTDLPHSARLLQEEIFGPILPLLTYKTTDEAIRYINEREKPLALYIYCRDQATVSHILKQTRAGSSCINTNLLQYSNHHLPFGGVNHSGIGKTHGFFGFREFSNQRAILQQNFPTAMELLFPPYSNIKQRLADFTLKWL